MDSIVKALPSILTEAGKSDLGILGLLIIMASILGFYFFHKEPLWVRLIVFLLFAVGTTSYATAVFKTRIINITKPTNGIHPQKNKENEASLDVCAKSDPPVWCKLSGGKNE